MLWIFLVSVTLQLFLIFSYKIDSITLDPDQNGANILDPDPNWVKILESDPYSKLLDLDPQHWLLRRIFSCKYTLIYTVTVLFLLCEQVIYSIYPYLGFLAVWTYYLYYSLQCANSYVTVLCVVTTSNWSKSLTVTTRNWGKSLTVTTSNWSKT